MDTIRIATRKSPLALWQAEHVTARLRELHPGLNIELVPMVTKGDKILDSPLALIGGKGLFVKELEQGMLDGHADIAVHSMKDVPAEFPEGLGLSVILDREDPCDAFVSARYTKLDDLPEGAQVGTASMRRQCQILARRPDLKIGTLRGNVGTRLGKLDSGEFDAIILAAAGLKRLQLEDRIASIMEPDESLPAVGQGAIGIECRIDDDEVNALLAPLNDDATSTRIRAERAMNARLHGSCQVPLAGYSVIEGDELWLRGLVGQPDGGVLIRAERRGSLADAEKIGQAVADELLANGADKILAALSD